jgi:thymidylate synthase ThyX
VDGTLRCLGPSSHLKARFGSGYQIEIRFLCDEMFEDCMSLCLTICETTEVEERHGQFIRLVRVRLG